MIFNDQEGRIAIFDINRYGKRSSVEEILWSSFLSSVSTNYYGEKTSICAPFK